MIQFQVNQQILTARFDPVVADTIQYVECAAEYTEDWGGTSKFLHVSKGEESYTIPFDEPVTLPLSKGVWSFWIHGNIFEDGDVKERITTNIWKLFVQGTGLLDGEPFPEMTPSFGEYYVAQMNGVLETMRSVKDEVAGISQEAQNSATSAAESAENVQELVNATKEEFKGLMETFNENMKEIKALKVTLVDSVSQIQQDAAKATEASSAASTALSQANALIADLDEKSSSFDQKYTHAKEALEQVTIDAISDIAAQKSQLEDLIDSSTTSVTNAGNTAINDINGTYIGMLEAIDTKGDLKLSVIQEASKDAKDDLQALIEQFTAIKQEMTEIAVQTAADLKAVQALKQELETKQYKWGDLKGGEE